MVYNPPPRRRRTVRRQRRAGLEQLECRRVLAGQLETGLAFEHVYQSDPTVFVPWEESVTAAQGDLDRDGRLDLVVFTAQDQGTQFYAGHGDGRFADPVSLPQTLPAIPWMFADIDGDADQDLVSVFESQLYLSLNEGRQNDLWLGLRPFTNQPLLSEGGANRFAVADFSGDALLDLAIGSGTGVRVLLGQGNGSFDAGIDYPLTNGCQALVAGDLDGDGDLDLINAKMPAYGGAGPQSLDLLINDGEGVFEPRESLVQPKGNMNDLAVGDLDGDGDLDVAATHSYSYDGNVSVLLGDGRGGFDSDPLVLTVAGSPRTIDLGDIDADGDLDLCVAHTGGGHISYSGAPGVTVFVGHGSGSFDPRLYLASGEAVLAIPAQLDGSGALELAVITKQAQVQVLRHTSSDLLPPTSWLASSVVVDDDADAVGDWDGNGILDHVVNTLTGAELQLNPGSAAATTVRLGIHVPFYRMLLHDVTGDGRTDIVATGLHGVYVLRQNDDGSPGAPVITPMQTMSLIPGGIVDLNRDGIVDLILSDPSSVHVWLGRGDGRFYARDDSVIATGRAFHLADWDTDGFVDLLVLSGRGSTSCGATQTAHSAVYFTLRSHQTLSSKRSPIWMVTAIST